VGELSSEWGADFGSAKVAFANAADLMPSMSIGSTVKS
jgi:hypothetical protein